MGCSRCIVCWWEDRICPRAVWTGELIKCGLWLSGAHARCKVHVARHAMSASQHVSLSSDEGLWGHGRALHTLPRCTARGWHGEAQPVTL